MKKDLRAIEKVYAEKIQQVGIRGTADWHTCVNGWFVAIESKKTGKEKPEPLQCFKLDKVKKAGGYALKATPENWDDILAFILKLAKYHHPKSVHAPKSSAYKKPGVSTV